MKVTQVTPEFVKEHLFDGLMIYKISVGNSTSHGREQSVAKLKALRNVSAREFYEFLDKPTGNTAFILLEAYE